MAVDSELQSLIDQRQNALNFIAANVNNPQLAQNVANARSFAEASNYSIQQKEIALAQQAAARSNVPTPTNTTIQNLQNQLNQATTASNAAFVNDDNRTVAEKEALDNIDALQMQLVTEQAKAATTGATPLVTVPTSTVAPYTANAGANTATGGTGGTVVDTKPTTSISTLDTKQVGGLTSQPANATGTGGIPALTTADLALWGKTLPQGLTSEQLTTALNAQQSASAKSYADALSANQTSLTKQNEEFLKNWNTSADTLKNSILTGVDTKNQQFGTQATQGFMDAFKNFQIPTNQQTGVNLGNYNDNRNAAADQWWSQYVTGRR